MISLNDYLYEGHTVVSILHKYEADLRRDAITHHNSIDMAHCNFLTQLLEILEHNEFLTDQSQRIQEFYAYMARKYPYLAFAFKGRIKSLVRAEEKFNGYLAEYIGDYYEKNGEPPTTAEIRLNMKYFRDLIAYRIVIQVPKCHVPKEMTAEEMENHLIYEIANVLPEFLEERGFSPEPSGLNGAQCSPELDHEVRPYYRDYIAFPSGHGYQSLHITFYDNHARNFVEIQLRTKQMDDLAEIGVANHQNYEKEQAANRSSVRRLPEGLCSIYDDALLRSQQLLNLDLSKVDVNMFTALDNKLINDSSGFFRGRLILPYEHLSSMQSDRF